MNQYRLIFILFIGLITTTAFAQNKISGKLSDHDTREALPYATVRLLQQDLTFVAGTVTDSLGHYRISDIKNGDYLIYFSTVGYKPKVIQVSVRQDTNLPMVEMESDNVMLGEVIIKRNTYQHKQDHLLIIPDREQVKHAGTGYDLLYNLMIPGLDVDRLNGKVSTLGNEIGLYINGRKVDYREVQSLRPKDVIKIEYYDMPTSKYIGDVAVINYITKHTETGGYISMDGKQTIGYLNGDYNTVFKLAHKNTDYTFFTGHTMNRYNSTMNDDYESFSFFDSEVDRHAVTQGGKIRNNSQYAQLNVSNRTSQRTLVGKIAFVRNDTPENNSFNLLKYTGRYFMQQESFKNTNQKGLMPSLELYGYFNIKNNQYFEMTLNGSYANNEYIYMYQENQYNTLSTTNEDIYTVFGHFKYGIHLKKQQTLSVRFTQYNNISSSLYQNNTSSEQNLLNTQSILYLIYDKKFGKTFSLMVAPGLSSLQYKLKGNERTGQFLPRLHIGFTYRPNLNQLLKFSGDIGNNMPVISYLNTAEQEIDPLVTKRGNAQLNTALFGVISLAYSGTFNKLNIQAAIRYEGGKHITSQDFFTEGNKLIKSYRSDVSANFLTGNLSATLKINNHFHLKADGLWRHVNGFKGVRDKLTNFSASFQANYFWKDLSCSIYAKTKSASMGREFIHTTTPARYGLSLGWSHNEWRIEAGTENPFTKHSLWKHSIERDIYTYYNEMTSRIYQQTGYVKVAYTFDFGRKTSREQNDVNRNINSAILKVN